MKKIAIIIPSYNNEKWCERNIISVLNQEYDNFRIIFTDDQSTDKTFEITENIVNNHKNNEKVKLLKNNQRLGAMHNLYNMIHGCDDDEIVITVDGDDDLASRSVLSRINTEYSSGDVLMTYGSYQDMPAGTRGCARPIARNIIDSNSFRRHPWCFSHLRTFLAGVFKTLPASDFQDNNGNWLQVAWDLPIMFGCAERAGHKIRYIHDILYNYRHDSPIQDYKIKLKEQQDMERLVRSREPNSRL